MFFKSTTALVSLGLMLGAAAPAATADEAATTLKQLPKEGYVVLIGSVDDIDGEKEFTLRSAEGETIEVNSITTLALNEGDRVRVTGVLDDTLLGLGQEIDSAKVVVLDAATESTSDYTDTDVSLTASADVTMDADASVETYYTIDALPDEGQVKLVGHVTDVDADDNTFRLKGKSGETIDVHPTKPTAVRAGQKVEVIGTMNEEVADLIGEEIIAATVTVVS
jgi:hypothetical protein